MPWISLPWNDERVATLCEEFEVRGIPSLVILKPDGTVVTKDARGDVDSKGSAALDSWK